MSVAKLSNGLTPKQEAFCLAYVETNNATEAYRRAYNVENPKANSVYVNANKLMKHDLVARRIEQLRNRAQQAAMERHDISIDTLTAMLKEDRLLAHKVEAPAAAVSAVMGIAKLHGLIVDKAKVDIRREITDLTDYELAAIAAGSSEGAAEASSSAAQPDQLH